MHLILLPYTLLVYTTQVISAFHAHWLASSEPSTIHLRAAEEKQNGFLFQVMLLSNIDPLVIQLVWYILKQLLTSVSVKVVDIYPHFSE